MNLGQLLGEQQLRIWELEEQLATGQVPKRAREYVMPVAAQRAGGIAKQLREVLASARGPMSVEEVKRMLPHFPRQKLASNLQVMASQGRLVRIGYGRDARFRLP